MDVELLARIQFAITAGFHYLYPPISIGLGLILIIMEAKWMRTGEKRYEVLTKFWVKVFALVFAMGVATGIVMEFEFGTNWATYSRVVGDIFGSPLAAEGVFAFFLESGFLAILLFGWNRVSKKLHFISTILVAFGAHLSAVWILVANSWQQTPAGHKIVGEGAMMRVEITDFWEMVFNPSTVDRLTHSITTAWLTGALFVTAIAAWYLLKGRHLDFARSSMKIGIVVAFISSLLVLGTGHMSSIGITHNQPAKLAAVEGHYETGVGDMYLFGWVDEEAQKVYGVKLPGFLTFLVHFDFTTEIKGLNEFPEDERPPVNIVFQTYHLMISLGMLMILIGLLGVFYWWRGSLFDKRWFLWLLVPSVLLPQISNQVGWITAEVGRQPWIVYGILRTKDALSKTVSSGEVWFSLVMFTLIYILIFSIFIFLLFRKIKHGPEEVTNGDKPAKA